MDAESYLHWLGSTDLDSARPDDLRLAVDVIVSTLVAELGVDRLLEDGDDGHEMLQALQAIQLEMLAGQTPAPRLAAFRRDFLYDNDLPEPPQVVLERELREIAQGIARARWSTETYENLERAIDRFLDGGDEDSLWSAVDSLAELIDRVESSYRQTVILPKEVTMESLVTHRLLLEGIHEWAGALEMLRDDETDDEPDWSAVLERAETGNRLLVAVQIYHQRLQTVLSSY